MPSPKGERFKVFISYSTRDKDVAEKFEKAFLDIGLSVWRDSRSLKAGETFPEEIAAAIDGCRYFVFLVSRHSADSPWVRKELGYANKLGKPIFPFHLEKDADRFLTRDIRLFLASVQHGRWEDGNREAQVARFAKEVKDGTYSTPDERATRGLGRRMAGWLLLRGVDLMFSLPTVVFLTLVYNQDLRSAEPEDVRPEVSPLMPQVVPFQPLPAPYFVPNRGDTEQTGPAQPFPGGIGRGKSSYQFGKFSVSGPGQSYGSSGGPVPDRRWDGPVTAGGQGSR